MYTYVSTLFFFVTSRHDLQNSTKVPRSHYPRSTQTWTAEAEKEDAVAKQQPLGRIDASANYCNLLDLCNATHKGTQVAPTRTERKSPSHHDREAWNAQTEKSRNTRAQPRKNEEESTKPAVAQSAPSR